MSRLPFDPVPQLTELDDYSTLRHPGPVELKLDGNEGPQAPAVASILAGLPAERWRRYPSARDAEAVIAGRLGVAPESVVLTAGADDALDRVLRTVAGPGREVVLTDPGFTTLERLVRLCGATPVPVPWWDGPFPVRAVLDRVGPATAAVAVVSPNNPTGSVIGREELDALARGVGRRLLLLDHAYVELADEDLTAAALAHPNAVVVRTLSKAWGLAGLRLGYAVARPAVAALIRRAGQPYPVSAASLAVAERLAAGDGVYAAAYAARVRRLRRVLLDGLAARGIDVPPSQANFVLPRLGPALWVRDGLAGLGIAVRVFPENSRLADRARITVPDDEAGVERLLAAIDTLRAPQALLLDMDGVLADVSGSYREAIRATAAAYGVALSAAEITAAKAAGGANDDWALTRRLLAERGVEVGLDEVVERFESAYQGAPGRPGLRLRERLLPAPDVLRALAERLPLAVVTGRPRADAEAFLDAAGIAGAVSALVTMEDAPSKPDPAPVRLAMERLGVSRAWMVGDTPDDVRAARAAGVLPLGVIPSGEDAAAWRRVLLAAGAGRVLDGLDELLEVLP